MNTKILKNKKVMVAMSGGVDSSVAAALLKKHGYRVAGVFMHFWSEPNGSKTQNNTEKNTEQHRAENKCCSAEAERIARRVASKLYIPFYVMHFEKEFKKVVVDYFLKEYSLGRTPNPCVVCNREIKFGLLFKKMLALNFDYLATGHYARRMREIPNPLPAKRTPRRVASQIPNYRYKLLKAKDKTKDQSYFLWTLGQKQLARLLFPVGDYTKKQVYQLAKKWNLPYRKAESFDICFIAGKDHNEFLKKHLKLKLGPIVDTNGNMVGQHEGLPLYTIGQRKDIRIGGIGPFYVIGDDLKTNTLFVTNKQFDRRLYKKSLVAENINWISGIEPKLPLQCQARIRYGHPAVPAVLKKQETPHQNKFGAGQARNKKQLFVEFKNSQRAVTSGQSVVFYQRNELLGGGVIS